MVGGNSTLSRNKFFVKLWAGETVSLVGSQVTTFALPLTAIGALHATPLQVGVLGAAGFAPFLFVTPFAGAWLDHRRRRPVMLVANLGRAAALGLVPLLALAGRLSLASLDAIAFLAGVLTVFFHLAYQSYLPAVVGRGQLVAGNGALAASESIADLSGPGVAGILVQLLGAPIAIAADVLSFLVSALSLGWGWGDAPEPLPDRADGQRERQGSGPGLWREIGEGFRVTFGNPYLRAFAGEAATYNLFWQVVDTVLALYAVRVLGLSPLALGLVFATGSAGALLGATLTGRVARRHGLGPTIVGAATLSAVAPVLIPLAGDRTVTSVAILAGALFVRGIGVSGCNVHAVSIRQAITPDHLLGRMNGSYRLVTWGAIPLGALLGGTLGQDIGPRATLLVGALGLATAALWLALSPVRRLRHIPASLSPDHVAAAAPDAPAASYSA